MIRVALDSSSSVELRPALGLPNSGSLVTQLPAGPNPVHLAVELDGRELVRVELHDDGTASLSIDGELVTVLDGQGHAQRLTMAPAERSRLVSGREAEHVIAQAAQAGLHVWAGYGCGRGCVDWRHSDHPPSTCSHHHLVCEAVVEAEVSGELDRALKGGR